MTGLSSCLDSPIGQVWQRLQHIPQCRRSGGNLLNNRLTRANNIHPVSAALQTPEAMELAKAAGERRSFDANEIGKAHTRACDDEISVELDKRSDVGVEA